MQLLLLRHGLAEPTATSGRDQDRALTPEGRQRLVDSIPGLLSLGLSAEQLWTSPWKRAVETAQLLRPLSRGSPALFQSLAEPPAAPLQAALQEFETHCGATLALIGHQPWLGALARWLLTGKRGDAEELSMPKGGLLWLSGEPVAGGMRLELFARPARLIALGTR